MKAITLNTVFTRSIPATLEPETLYVSMEYRTAVHLCACACGAKVVTPLGPNDWVLSFDGKVSLRPSIGNGQQPCRSHYYIRNDHIDWLPPISTHVTEAALTRDRSIHGPAVVAPKVWWCRLWDRIRGTSVGRGWAT
ncbi:MAG: hypothetical protein BGO26_05380 [Actinobacteria bacterium 69-20]|nr:hypothetical protein [Actinomycetota bacterium]OJV25178.1 MAG: hypothetical protein BGO26_05380 [Actinobacteria bacterium 69-20]